MTTTSNTSAQIGQPLFFKNVAVVGGFLALVAWGPGDWSLDARRARV